jgi:hypothetical protein
VGHGPDLGVGVATGGDEQNVIDSTAGDVGVSAAGIGPQHSE